MKKTLLLLSGSGGGGSQPTLISKNISANGTYAASSDSADGYSSVTVDVQPNLGTKSITDNGTYTAVADSVDGFSSVTVAVPEKTLTTKTITQNGAYAASEDNADGYSSLTVSVLPNLGTKTVTSNGAYAASEDSLDGYSSLTVSVSPNLGTKTVTANGTYSASSDNLDGFSSFTVNVAGAGKYKLKRNVYNYDGTLISSDIISKGDAVYLPASPPTIDDDLVEFAEWTCTTDELTVSNSYNIGAICRVKEQIDLDGTLVRPSIFEINLTQDTGLTPTIRYNYLKGAPLYIDWGDGTAVDTINDGGTGYGSGTKDHSYSSAGKYYIKMYSVNEYGLFSATWSTYVFGNQTYNACVTKAYIGDNWGGDAYAFYRSSLSKCIITNGALNLGAYFCYSCYGLSSVIIPKQITSIPSNAFWGEGTKIVILPYTLTTFTSTALQRSILVDFVLPNHLTTFTKTTNGQIRNNVTIVPSSFTSLGDYAFYSNTSEYIELPNSCVSFGIQAFGSCSCLKELSIPSGTTTLGSQCFGYCYSLESIELPSTLTSISANCFAYCYALKELTIPNSVTTIGSNAWQNCYGLTTLKIPTNFASALSLATLFALSDSSYISIAKDLADLTGETAQTFSIQNWQQAKLANMFVDSNGDLDATSSTSLIDFITAKNWTVTIVS